jgi:hypothetical protein
MQDGAMKQVHVFSLGYPRDKTMFHIFVMLTFDPYNETITLPVQQSTDSIYAVCITSHTIGAVFNVISAN